MSEIQKILAIVGIIWLAHIPFVIPFFMAAANSDKPRASKGPISQSEPEESPNNLAQTA